MMLLIILGIQSIHKHPAFEFTEWKLENESTLLYNIQEPSMNIYIYISLPELGQKIDSSRA